MSDIAKIRSDCQWPTGWFAVRDELGEHGQTWLILPDGAMVSISYHNDPSVNPAQCSFIAEACNAVLDGEDEKLIAERDAAQARAGEMEGLLRDLTAMVRGECPSLLNEDSGGDANLSLRIDAALATSPHRLAGRGE